MVYKRAALLVLLCFFAGLLGGIVSSRTVVHAETAPKILLAEEFRVVDAQGQKWGAFGVGPDGLPYLVLYDQHGRLLWSARHPTPRVQPAK